MEKLGDWDRQTRRRVRLQKRRTKLGEFVFTRDVRYIAGHIASTTVEFAVVILLLFLPLRYVNNTDAD